MLFSCVMTHTVVLVIQDGQTALDYTREVYSLYAEDEDDKSRYDQIIKYLEELGKR